MATRRGSQETWQRILDSAETLFARQGYSGTSTRQIAQDACISIQTLQYHCKGKKNLYKAVMERSVVPVTDFVNRHVQKMVEQDLHDPRVLEASVTRTIDELFDLLHAHPNYAQLFYRQWLVSDPDLRSVEWEKLIPFFRQWSGEIKARLSEKRLGNMNLFLFFLTLAWMYWGLFTQPGFLARFLEVDPDSKEFLAILKDHALEMTMRMTNLRVDPASSPSPKAAGKKRKSSPGKRVRKP